MGLWIRTQNRKSLLEVKGVSMATDFEKEEYVIYAKNVQDYAVGKYKTKERALEVIDMIQGALVGVNRNNKI